MKTDSPNGNANQTQPSFDCPICKDQEGSFYNDDNGNEYWRDCECIKKRQIERLMRSSQITEEFQKKTFGNFNTEGRPEVVHTAYQTARKYVIDFPTIKHTRQNSAALLGRPGSGKTHLIMAIANNLIQKGTEVIYFPWVEGFNELKSDFDKSNDRISRLQRAEVLFIDDMFKGREKPTPYQMEQLFAIVNYRYLENLPILASSEKTIAEMCEFDEAIGSRINEMCRDYKVILTGGIELNYRLQ